MANERFADFVEDNPKLFVQGLYTTSTTQKHKLGTRRRISDGREFMYIKAAANLAAGYAVMGHEADPANVANLAITANQAAGNKEVPITLGDSALANTANFFAEGFLYINTGAGVIGDMYKIRGHAAIAANGSGTIKLYDSIRTLITTSHKASLVAHPCAAVKTANGAAVTLGVAPIDIGINSYGWIQTKGPCAIATDGTLVVEQMAFLSVGAGEAMPSSGNAIDMIKLPHLGYVIQVNANDHASIIDLKL